MNRKEKQKETQRRYRLSHPNVDKEYKEKNKSKISQQNKEYYFKNKEKISKYKREWLHRNPNYFKDYYQRNKEIDKIRSKKWRIENKQYKQKLDREWKQNNPDKVLESNLKQLQKDSNKLNMESPKYKWAIQSWSQTIKNRDKICQICYSEENLNAHHILYRKYHPELSFNVNNGITLCEPCHLEVHN